MEINHNKRSVQSSIRSYILKQIKWAVFMGIFGSEKKTYGASESELLYDVSGKKALGLRSGEKIN